MHERFEHKGLAPIKGLHRVYSTSTTFTVYESRRHNMMWEYVRFEDDTQVSYSDVKDDNTVLVVIERPKDWGFDTAKCLLPAYLWIENDGFSEQDLAQLDTFVHNNAPLIMRFAYEGGRQYA